MSCCHFLCMCVCVAVRARACLHWEKEGNEIDRTSVEPSEIVCSLFACAFDCPIFHPLILCVRLPSSTSSPPLPPLLVLPFQTYDQFFLLRWLFSCWLFFLSSPPSVSPGDQCFMKSVVCSLNGLSKLAEKKKKKKISIARSWKGSCYEMLLSKAERKHLYPGRLKCLPTSTFL